jgi:hypothetical protein
MQGRGREECEEEWSFHRPPSYQPAKTPSVLGFKRFLV